MGPAEGVGKLCRNPFEVALDGVDDEVGQGDGRASSEEDGERQLVVEPENLIVDDLFAGLREVGHDPQRRVHAAAGNGSTKTRCESIEWLINVAELFESCVVNLETA